MQRTFYIKKKCRKSFDRFIHKEVKNFNILSDKYIKMDDVYAIDAEVSKEDLSSVLEYQDYISNRYNKYSYAMKAFKFIIFIILIIMSVIAYIYVNEFVAVCFIFGIIICDFLIDDCC